jgi:serine/threonine protein kinase
VTEPKIDGYAMDSYDPATQSPLEIPNVIEIFRLVGKALAFAHHRNLIHHDICPENIHIDARGTIRLKNYFISRFVYETESQLGETSSVSPMFISPEKVKGQPEDLSSDIFSFGATFYFLMTGQYPFYGENKDEILHSRVMNTVVRKKSESAETFREDVFNTEAPTVDTGKPSVAYRAPTHLSQLRPEIPAEISDLVMSAMKPNPATRPRISAVMGALEEFNAMLDRKQGIEAAQRQMVLTKTIGINVSAFRPKKKSKGITSLFKQD